MMKMRILMIIATTKTKHCKSTLRIFKGSQGVVAGDSKSRSSDDDDDKSRSSSSSTSSGEDSTDDNNNASDVEEQDDNYMDPSNTPFRRRMLRNMDKAWDSDEDDLEEGVRADDGESDSDRATTDSGSTVCHEGSCDDENEEEVAMPYKPGPTKKTSNVLDMPSRHAKNPANNFLLAISQI
jgi:hypothetical protein